MFFHEEDKNQLARVEMFSKNSNYHMTMELPKSFGALRDAIDNPKWFLDNMEGMKQYISGMDNRYKILLEELFLIKKMQESPPWMPEYARLSGEIVESIQQLIRVINDKEFLEEVCIKSLAEAEMKRNKPRRIRKKIKNPEI